MTNETVDYDKSEQPTPDARAERYAQTIAVALANVSALPEWLVIPALGRDMRPVGDVAARAVTAVADAEIETATASLSVEVERLCAGWRKVTTALGYGDGVTEPQISHDNFLELMREQARDADEWREHELWRGDCFAAGHLEDEDCHEHNPRLRLEAAERALVAERTRVARVEALLNECERGMFFRSDFVSTLDIREALTEPEGDR